MFYRTCRRILPLTLALLLIISCVPIAYTADFSDVARSHWAYSYIHDAVDRKLIQGYGDRRFHPEEPVSVQAFLSMVCRTDGLDDRQLQSGSNWADPAVAYGSYFGWFEPKELGVRTASISREFATQLLICAFYPEAVGLGEELTFRDQDAISPKRLP